MNKIEIQPHANQRAIERGATEAEIIRTTTDGELFPAKFGRTGARMNFSFDSEWNGVHYKMKQIECFFVDEANKRIVITVIVKYY